MLPKPHAHLHTLKKIHAQFKKDQYETVSKELRSRHPLCNRYKIVIQKNDQIEMVLKLENLIIISEKETHGFQPDFICALLMARSQLRLALHYVLFIYHRVVSHDVFFQNFNTKMVIFF